MQDCGSQSLSVHATLFYKYLHRMHVCPLSTWADSHPVQIFVKQCCMPGAGLSVSFLLCTFTLHVFNVHSVSSGLESVVHVWVTACALALRHHVKHSLVISHFADAEVCFELLITFDRTIVFPQHIVINTLLAFK